VDRVVFSSGVQLVEWRNKLEFMIKKLPFQLSGTKTPDRSISCAFVILMILLIPGQIFSQAQLLKDINTSREPYYSEISEFTNVGTFTYFISANELWKTDGTAANTLRMKAFKTLSTVTAVGTTLYFAADDGRGLELWKTNGTPEGTVILRDIRPGTLGSTPMDLINANGILYFTANNGTNGKEVWKSNGTAGGTVMVKDIMIGAGSSGANRLTNVNGIVYFQANDNLHGYELWKTNGTAAGTVMVKDIGTGTKVGSFPELLTNVSGKLFFVAADNTTGRELWKSDGTVAGTVRVKDIVAGSGSAGIDNSTNVNGVLYFTASVPAYGKELWKSNGTATGTVMVKDIRQGSAGADGHIPMGQFKILNAKLYFVASDDPYYGNMGLYTTDGTAAGTKRLLSLTYIQDAGYNLQLTYYKGSLYFFNGSFINDETPIVALEKINPDGTGYAFVKRIYIEYYAASFPAKMIAGSTYLLFSGRLSGTSGYQLNRSDGTAPGTVGVKDTFVSTAGSSAYQLVTVGNVTYFIATTGSRWGLYRTDGTPAGTVLLANYYLIRDLTRVGGRLFFFATPAYGGDEGLYKIENGSSAPQLLKGGMLNTYRLTAVGNLVYFAQVHYEENYDDLWRSDGTAAGTVKLAQFLVVKNIFDYNGTAMLGILREAGLELWKSNGTTATTVKITDMTTATLRHYELRPYAMTGGIYYFGLEDGTHGFEMWRTNGTASGTFMIEDLRSGDTSFPMEYDIASAAAFQSVLYFSARDNAGVWALFKTGSTAGSAVKLRDLNGPAMVLVPLSNTLIALTHGPDGRLHVWGSDGTTEGTEYQKSLGTTTDYVDPVVINDVMYFNTSNNTYESEYSLVPAANESMWRSDGTACGTFYFDIGAYRPYPMEPLGTKLIFRGYTVRTGAEPFAYNTTLAPANPCGTPDARIATASTEDQMSAANEEIFSFGPNPFTNDLRFTINGQENERARVIVYTIAGAPVQTMENLDLNTEYTIGQDWALGIYIMKVNVGPKTVVEKVIKK
jgi:ELWxxDGT repeat protein